MIKLENISKYYSSKTSITQALRNINLEFKLGEFVAITGESGSGKTTLLNIISGIDTFEDGDIYVDGIAISNFDEENLEKYRRENIAFIFQNNNLIDSYTVLKNVETALVIQGLSSEDRIKKSKEIIEKVGLTSRIKHRASKLSGGEKQRLAIARALAMDTKIIIADEPTGSLDSKTGDQIISLLSELSADKLVLVVTHNYQQIQSYVSRKIRIFNGEVVEDEKFKKVQDVEHKTIKFTKDKQIEKAVTLSLFNIFGQPKKSIFFILISFVLVFFVFFVYSYVLVYVDPAIEEYTYINQYPERLVVKRQDDNPMTEDDFNYLSKDRRVEKVIKEDIIIDMYFTSHRIGSNSAFNGQYDPKLRDTYNSDIIGRLPVADNEILLSTFFDPGVDVNQLDLINKEVIFQVNDHSKAVVEKFVITGIVVADEMIDKIYITDHAISTLYNNLNTDSIIIKINQQQGEYNLRVQGNRFVVDEGLEGLDIYSLYITYIVGEDVSFSMSLEGNALNMVESFDKEDTELVYLSQELYDKLFPINQFIKEYQYTIHLKNKFDSESLSKKLLANGYYVYSPFYDSAKSVEDSSAIGDYLRVLITQIVVYLVIFVAYMFSYLIYKVVLRTKVKDYVIFKVLGANNKLIKKTILFEFVFSFIIAYIIFFIVYIFINSKYPILYNYRFKDYVLIFIINFVLTSLIVRLYLKSLRKKTIFTNLKDIG